MKCQLFTFLFVASDCNGHFNHSPLVKLRAHELSILFSFQGLPYLGVRIKWPNDLYLNGLKVGGILCTSTYKSKKFNVSAGKLARLLKSLMHSQPA